MIFQICIALITRWDNSSESYWETVRQGKIMERKPNLFLTLPGSLWLQVEAWASYYPKSEMIQCGQINIISPILLPAYRVTIFSFSKTEGLGDNINRLCYLQVHYVPSMRWNKRALLSRDGAITCHSNLLPHFLVFCLLCHLGMGLAPAAFELLTPDLEPSFFLGQDKQGNIHWNPRFCNVLVWKLSSKARYVDGRLSPSWAS